MALFQEAIALNNRATHLIVSKRHNEEAIPILKKALCSSKAAIEQLEQPQEDQVVGSSQTCLLDECVANALMSEDQKTEVDDDDFNTACEESFFIHRTPLPISSTTSTLIQQVATFKQLFLQSSAGIYRYHIIFLDLTPLARRVLEQRSKQP